MPTGPKKIAPDAVPRPNPVTEVDRLDSEFDPGATDIILPELAAGEDTILEQLSASHLRRLAEAITPTDPLEDAFDYSKALDGDELHHEEPPQKQRR